MAHENVLAPAPTRSDHQILPFAAWIPIGKSSYNGTYVFEVDETQFILDANLLREALEITPIDQAHQFVSPPPGEAIMDFVNELGGDADEVFGMLISNELISNNIRNAPYYNAYLEMVAKHDQKVAAEKVGKMKTAIAKQPKLKLAIEKLSKLAPVPKPKTAKERPFKASTTKPPKPKHAKEKSTKTTPPQQASKGKIAKVLKVKSPFQLVDEPGEELTQSKPRPELEHQGATSEKTNRVEKTDELDQGQAGLDLGRTPKSRPLPEQVVMDEDQARPDPGVSRGALAGPDLEPTLDEFMADLYPKANMDELLTEKDKTRKRQRNDQDPPPPDLDLIEDIPMPDTANVSDSKDTDYAYLPKIKQMLEWLKPIPNDERPATPEPSWTDWANPEGDQVRIDISKPLPLSGPPVHVITQTKGSGQALSISKMKAAF
nr:hypothetical protein [Tanacetum cinerariifolium]